MPDPDSDFDSLYRRVEEAASQELRRPLAQLANEAARQEFYAALPPEPDPPTTLRVQALYSLRVLQLHKLVPTLLPNCAVPARQLWKLARQLAASGVRLPQKLPLPPSMIPDTEAAIKAVERFQRWLDESEPCPGEQSTRLGETGPPAQASFEEGPFDLRFRENRRAISRGDNTVEMGGHGLCWSILKELCSKHPEYYPTGALVSRAWHAINAGRGRRETLYRHISRLNRQFLRPLGLIAANRRGLGYLLQELPPASSSATRPQRPSRRRRTSR